MHKVQMKILQVISDLTEDSKLVEDTQIADKLNLKIEEIQDHLDIMEKEDLILLSKCFGPCYSAFLKPKGRMELQEPGLTQQGTKPQVFNILHVIDSNIQNIAQTGNTNFVNQSVDSNLNEKIFKTIDKMVDIVRNSDDIDQSIKNDYEIESEGLKLELKKSQLNLNRIRDMISFLSDADSTLNIAAKVAPYLPILLEYIKQLF